MKLNEEERKKITALFPRRRGNVTIDNDRFLDAIIYMAENGCAWRSLPSYFGTWHTVYVRFNRWAKTSVLERVFHALQSGQIPDKPLSVVSPDAASVKAHPDAAGALKKTGTKR